MWISFFSPLALAPGWAQSPHPAEAWHQLYPKIRDRLIEKERAREEMRGIELSLKTLCRPYGFDPEEPGLLFPLMGYGPDAIGGLSSARVTNEDNYVFQKFMRAAIGTNNVDHCARL